MRVWKRLVPRAGIAAFGLSFLTISFSVLVIMNQGMLVLPRQARQVFVPFGAERLIEQCEQDPSRWTFSGEDGGVGWAYDPTLVSQNPLAPRFDLGLAYRLRESDTAARLFFRDGYGGAVAMRLGVTGPCSVFVLMWPVKDSRYAVLAVLCVLGLVISSLIVAVGLVWFVRPVIEQIRALSAKAAAVGTDVEMSDHIANRDELDELERAMVWAHRRIRQDADRLRQANASLEHHLAAVAHDLRTPLSVVQLELEWLLTREESPELQRAVRSCLDNAVYMAALIDNLRTEARLRSLPQGSARASLCGSATSVVNRIRPFAVRRGASLELAIPDEDVWVGVESLFVEQLISNLVYNAVTHNDQVQVAIIVDVSEGEFRLMVLDDGGGMGDGPHGLGLRIVQEIAQRAGWKVVFQTGPDGTRVVVTGPIVSGS